MFLKLYKHEEGVRNSQKIKKMRNYVVYGIFGVLLRIGVMMIANYLLFITVLSDYLAFMSLDFLGLPGVTSWTAVIIVVIFINAETSLWDLIIPYIVVFGFKIDQKFAIW